MSTEIICKPLEANYTLPNEFHEIATIKEFKFEFCTYEGKDSLPDFVRCALLDTYEKDFSFNDAGIEIPDYLKVSDLVTFSPSKKTTVFEFNEKLANYIYNEHHVKISMVKWKNRIYDSVTIGWYRMMEIADTFDNESIKREYLDYVHPLYVKALCCILQHTKGNDMRNEFWYFTRKMSYKLNGVMENPEISDCTRHSIYEACKAEDLLCEAYSIHMNLVNALENRSIGYITKNLRNFAVS